MIDVKEVVQSHMDYLINESKRIAEQLAQIQAQAKTLKRLEALPAFPDLAGITLSWDYSKERAEIRLRLDKEHKHSPLLREIVAEFGGTITKSVHYDGESLDAKGEIGGLTLVVSSYLPASCQIVEEEYLVPAVPEHMGTRKKIVCLEPVSPLEAV